MSDFYATAFYQLKNAIETKQKIEWFKEKYDPDNDDIVVNIQLFYNDKIHDFTLSPYHLWGLFNFLEDYYETEINDIIKE
jgi:hypothetical protein